jgi:hypothetical protein
VCDIIALPAPKVRIPIAADIPPLTISPWAASIPAPATEVAKSPESPIADVVASGIKNKPNDKLYNFFIASSVYFCGLAQCMAHFHLQVVYISLSKKPPMNTDTAKIPRLRMKKHETNNRRIIIQR